MDKNVKEKTQVFNVIILDKSGSMGRNSQGAGDVRGDAGPLRVAGGLLQLRDEGTLRQGAGGRGASMAMAKDCSTRMNLFKKVHLFREKNMDGAMSEEDVANSYTVMANEAFDEVE